jgi:hypothetical protein
MVRDFQTALKRHEEACQGELVREGLQFEPNPVAFVLL